MEDTKKALYTNFDLRFHGTQVEIKMRRTVVEITWQLMEVKAQAGSCGRTGTGVGTVQPPKFDRSTSWAVFRQQFKTRGSTTTGCPARKPHT
jgi:hypothetical protein